MPLTDPHGSQYATESDSDTVFVKRVEMASSPLLSPANRRQVEGRNQGKAQDDFIFQAQVLPGARHGGSHPRDAQTVVWVERADGSTACPALTHRGFGDHSDNGFGSCRGRGCGGNGVAVTSPISFPLLLLFGLPMLR